MRALLAQPGLVDGVHYRPSFVTEMKARRAGSPSRNWLRHRLGRKTDAAGLAELKEFSAERQALAGLAHDYLRYQNGFYLNQTTDTLKAEHALLVARGRLGSPVAAGHPTAQASRNRP